VGGHRASFDGLRTGKAWAWGNTADSRQLAASSRQKAEDSRLRLMASARQGDQPTQGSFSTKNQELIPFLNLSPRWGMSIFITTLPYSLYVNGLTQHLYVTL
jgi:hypothetical protein